MARALASLFSAVVLVGCVTEHRATFITHGETYCVKHRIPLITVQGYRSRDDLLVHSGSPRALPCEERSPNFLWYIHSLTRDSLRPIGALISYCPRCQAEFQQCEGGHPDLGNAEVQQISSLALSCSAFRRPVIRVFPLGFGGEYAIAEGGHQDHVGDVFTRILLVRRHGRWTIDSRVVERRVVAIGRAQSIF
jgi:hypothetical protein